MIAEINTLRPSISLAGMMRGHRIRPSGSLIVAFSAIAFSTAGLFTRLIPVDVWTMLFWRGIFGGLSIAGFIAWRQRTGIKAAFMVLGWAGLVTAACSTLGTVCFITALRKTTVADVTIIYATAPFMAAALAWVWAHERPDLTTLAASIIAMVGVVIMCGAAFSSGQVVGDLLALTMTALMALMMVVIRKNRDVSMLPAACLSAFACAVLVLPLSHPTGVTAKEFGLLGLFGVTQFGLGLLLLTVGTRLIPATRASLLANLELPFAPLWVWLAFNELPSRLTIVGGGIVCAAVLLDLVAEHRQHDPASPLN
jgi:drug/metabolite transporter (DMT)-like permease